MIRVYNIAIWLSILLVLSACEQLGLSGSTSEKAKLSEEQIKARIKLQQELAGFQGLMERIQSQIDMDIKRRDELRQANAGNRVATPVKVGDKSPLGSDQAMVAIVEFTDYQSTFCGHHASATMPQIKSDYIDTGKIRYYVRDFPLVIHDQAKYAAVVARCAAKQGRFWAMHDKLFANQKRLDPRFYLQFSNDVGLDPALLSDCLTGKDAIADVDSDSLYGSSIGVDSTPAFFIGRIEGDQIVDVATINGEVAYSQFIPLLDNILALDAADRDIKSSQLRKIELGRSISRLEGELSRFNQ